MLKQLLLTSQGMHYQAAEKALLFLNSDVVVKLVKANMQKCFSTVVKGLIVSQQTPHWNQTVTTITYQLIRTYMELNRDQFERLTQQG